MLCLFAALAVGLASCGSGEGTTSDNPPETAAGGTSHPAGNTEPANAEDQRGAEVRRADAAKVGLILFNHTGYTLYHFRKDRRTTPTCYGPCAEMWPPLLTEGKPRARAIYHTKIGTTKRKDGTVQVTYAGHPLYTFTGDKATGDTNGNGLEAFGGKWFALHPSGEDAKPQEEP